MHRWIVGACVFYVGSVAVYYGYIKTDIVSLELQPYLNSKHAFTVQVISYPDRGDNSIKFNASIVEIDSHTNVVSKLLVRMDSDNHVEYGDVLELIGVIEQPESFISDTGRIFNYPAYLATENIYGIIEPTQVVRINNEGNYGVRALYRMRTWLVNRLGDYFSGNQHGLLAGMLIGEKSLLSKEVSKGFQVVGLSHIVVLSGYNITLVVSAIMYIVRWCGLGYRSRRIGGLLVIPLFVVMTGLGASSLRAGIMSCLQLITQIDTRAAPVHLVILYVLTAMVAASPSSLIYSPSLHLSFLAFLGLVYVVPLVKSLDIVAIAFKKVESHAWITAILTMIIETVSVQLFVLPYIMYMSGTFSALALLVNILVVPLVSWIMFGGMVVVALSLVSGVIAEMGAVPVRVLLEYIITLSTHTALFHKAYIVMNPISTGALVGTYTLAGLFIVLWHYKTGTGRVTSDILISSS